MIAIVPYGAAWLIVITVGHRGDTPMRGKAYHRYGYGNMRDYPLEDDKYAIEQLAQRHSFIDGKKVGIYGHSGWRIYGGGCYLHLSGLL